MRRHSGVSAALLLVLGFIGTRPGCVKKSGSEYEADQARVVPADQRISDHASECGVGTYDAVFDDFAYSKTGLNEDASPFGTNDWVVCDSATVVRYASRFWQRFNHEDVGFNNARVEVAGTAGQTEIKLIVEPDYTKGNSAMLRSGMVTFGGTWVARVKLVPLNPDAEMILAFWTQQEDPFDNRHELDFEFNNIWGSANPMRPVLHVTNHQDNPAGQGIRQRTRALDCLYETRLPGGNARKAPDCYDAQTGDNYLFGKYQPLAAKDATKPENEEYYNLIIRQYGHDSVEYAARNDGYRGVEGTVVAGPTVIDEFVPTKPMHIQLAVLIHKIKTTDGRLGAETSFAIDWVYYSPDESLLDMPVWDAADAITSEIATFRENGWPRVNTAGEVLFPSQK